MPKKHRSHVRRHGHWISANTQSLEYSIATNAATPVPVISNGVVNLTPTAPGCTTSSGGTSCTVTVQLAPGSYTIGLETYDGANATGNILSQAQEVPFTVHPAQTNVVNLTLDGVPYGLVVSSSSAAVRGEQSSLYTLYGTGAQTFVVNAVDPYGNVIVGPGAPQYSASFTSGGWASPAPAGSPNVNQFAITPIGTNGATATLHVTASFSDGVTSCASVANAVCSTDVALKNDIQTMFALVYERTATRYPYGSQTGVALSGLTYPVAMGFDRSNDLLVGDCGSGCGPPSTPWSVATYLCCTWTSTGDQTVSGMVDQPISIFTCASASGQANILTQQNTDPISYLAQTSGTWSAPSTILNTPPLTTLPGYSVAISPAACTAAFAWQSGGGTPPAAYSTTYSGGAWSPVAGLQGGGSYSSSVSTDPNGNLILSEDQTSCGACTYNVRALYSPAFTSSASLILTASTQGSFAEADARENLFVLSQDQSTISIYAPPYGTAPTTLTKALGSTVSTYAIDGQGDLWVAWSSSSLSYEIDGYAPPYTSAPFATIAQTGPVSQILFTP